MKVFLIAVSILASVTGRGQGLINFSTIGGSVQPNVWTYQEGVPMGAEFSAALYFAPCGTTDYFQFVQVGAPTGFLSNTGLILGGTREVPGLLPGETGNFHIRVWMSAFGSTFEEVGLSDGFSELVPVTVTAYPSQPSSLVAAANAAGIPLGGRPWWEGGLLPSESTPHPDTYVCPTPEPSVWVLMSLGVGLCLLRWRSA